MAKSVKWLGHAGFVISTPGGKTLVIDPWLSGNPSCPLSVDDIKEAQAVLVTHDHFDHVANAVEIVQNTNATLIATPETSNKLRGEGGLGESQIIGGMGMNIGGSVQVDGITITMTQAFHTSLSGVPCGYVITLEDGSRIYHAGDTGIFDSMRLIGELYPLDLALIPIGGWFTMDPAQASLALTLLKAKKVIPIHYKTFPVLEQSADNFVSLAKQKAPQVEVIVLEPGKDYSW
jgi:L-ascorbate metabolism protein UlaG (beta-lactamase superfamily)